MSFVIRSKNNIQNLLSSSMNNICYYLDYYYNNLIYYINNILIYINDFENFNEKIYFYKINELIKKKNNSYKNDDIPTEINLNYEII